MMMMLLFIIIVTISIRVQINGILGKGKDLARIPKIYTKDKSFDNFASRIEAAAQTHSTHSKKCRCSSH